MNKFFLALGSSSGKGNQMEKFPSLKLVYASEGTNND
jgi:hypothetical protein